MQHKVDLEALMAPVATGLGLEWVGLTVQPGSLCVYVDKPGGVALDDCQQLSRRLNAVLSVEEGVPDYHLEVSSPGVDRLLFTVEQCRPYIGRNLAIKLVTPEVGKPKIIGSLLSVDGDTLRIRVEEEELEVSFTAIKEARLVPEWK